MNKTSKCGFIYDEKFLLVKCLLFDTTHSYATHLLQSGIDLRSIQELLGYKSVEAAMIYTYVVAEMNRGKVASPLDM